MKKALVFGMLTAFAFAMGGGHMHKFMRNNSNSLQSANGSAQQFMYKGQNPNKGNCQDPSLCKNYNYNYNYQNLNSN
jgi:hypothetical protein